MSSDCCPKRIRAKQTGKQIIWQTNLGKHYGLYEVVPKPSNLRQPLFLKTSPISHRNWLTGESTDYRSNLCSTSVAFSSNPQPKFHEMAVDQYSGFRKTPSSRENKFLSRIFRDSIAKPFCLPFCLQHALWSHCGCCSYACTQDSRMRAVRSVKCKQSPSFALATCACR